MVEQPKVGASNGSTCVCIKGITTNGSLFAIAMGFVLGRGGS